MTDKKWKYAVALRDMGDHIEYLKNTYGIKQDDIDKLFDKVLFAVTILKNKRR